MKKLIDYDAITGVAEYYHSNPDGGFAIQTVQDVAPVLDANQKARSSASSNWKGGMHHIASIPQVVVEAWWKELGSDPFAKKNRPWLIARLNNRDWYKLRTKDGRL